MQDIFASEFETSRKNFIAQSTGKFLQVADVEHVQTRSRQDQNLHQHLR